MIYNDSITAVEYVGTTKGHFPMARVVRHGCPASGFCFTVKCDPVFRWLHGNGHHKGLPSQLVCSPDHVRRELGGIQD